jgi:hypothetical protein
MGPPLLIGAGIGAATSAAMGKNPFMGALLGGATGGLFGGAGGIGSGFAGGAGGTGAGTAGVSGLVGSNGQIASSLLSSSPAASGASFVTGADALRNAATNIGTGLNFTPPSALETLGSNITDTFGNIGGNIKEGFNNMSTMDKLGLGMKGYEAANPPRTPIDTSAQTGVRQGNPNLVAPNFNTNPSSTLQNVAPNPLQQRGNEIGLPNLNTTIPLTEEELLRLQQTLQTTGYRGR